MNKLIGDTVGIQRFCFCFQGDKTVSLSIVIVFSKNLPGLIPFAEEVLDIEVLPNPQIKEVKKKYVSKQKINTQFMDEIVSVFDEDRFSSSEEERLLHSHRQTTSEEVYRYSIQN